MDLTVWLAASCTAVVVAMAVGRLVPGRRRIHPRVLPYTQIVRSRLGAPLDPAYLQLAHPAMTGGDPAAVAAIRNPVVEVFGPILRKAAEALGGLVDAADRDAMQRRLRQAGMGELTVEAYRMRQLATTTAGLAAGAASGLLLGRGTPLVLVLMVCCGVPATTYWRNKALKAIATRAQTMRIETYTIAQLLAVLLRTGHAPVDAVRTLCQQASGGIVTELRQALEWTGGGLPAADAYRRLAEDAVDPAVARLYRLIATATRAGGDIAPALLVLAEDVRNERRQELARHAARRRMAMIAPTLILIAPVMLLFIAAAIPHIIFHP